MSDSKKKTLRGWGRGLKAIGGLARFRGGVMPGRMKKKTNPLGPVDMKEGGGLRLKGYARRRRAGDQHPGGGWLSE